MAIASLGSSGHWALFIQGGLSAGIRWNRNGGNLARNYTQLKNKNLFYSVSPNVGSGISYQINNRLSALLMVQYEFLYSQSSGKILYQHDLDGTYLKNISRSVRNQHRMAGIFGLEYNF